jgi:hypothetical protein
VDLCQPEWPKKQLAPEESGELVEDDREERDDRDVEILIQAVYLPFAERFGCSSPAR